MRLGLILKLRGKLSAKGKAKKGEAHIRKEWNSDCSSFDSNNKGLTAFNKSTLFPNKHDTCLMANEKKVCTQDTPKYTYSSNEESNDNDVDYSDLSKDKIGLKLLKSMS
jgi:hypothetical protein